MRKSFQLTSSFLACTVWLLTLSQSCNAQDGSAMLSKAYVTVNGQVQSNALAEILLREQLARGASDSTELQRCLVYGLLSLVQSGMI